MNFSEEMEPPVMKRKALNSSWITKPWKINTDDSAVTLRTPKATSSAGMRLTMWKSARPSKTSQKKKQRKPKQRAANVWIIGSSYIKRGEWAARQLFGENFGLWNARVKWFGKGGMGWDGVLPRFYAELSSQRPPDILVIHAGGNDLGLTSAQELSSVMMDQLLQLDADFPAMKIAFSLINERQVWRYGNPRWIDSNRRFVNSTVRKAVESFGGFVIEHPRLKYYDSEIFLRDGVHFSQRGNELFLRRIHSAIQRILQNLLQRT